MATNKQWYNSRAERSAWITKRFSKAFSNAKSVLDVGCWEADLKKYLPKGKKYYGIDIAGKPDKVVDLEKITKLPFKDKEYDVIVCTDVLEHIDNIHLVLQDMMRVSKHHVIITLPNPSREILPILFRKRYAKTLKKRKEYGKYSKYYGLPFERPSDRHRWFYTPDEADDLIERFAKANGFIVSVKETDCTHRTLSTTTLLLQVLFPHLAPNTLIYCLTRK